MSQEQKRNAMLEWFYQKKEFFVLKDIEKIVPKETGMPGQTVQDILKSLVNDNLVDTEKIGTSTFYWAFPSKAKHIKKQELDRLKIRLEEENKRLKSLREKIIAAKVGREDTEKRQKLLQSLQVMRADEERLTLEIQKYKDSDPEALEKMKNEIKAAEEAKERWNDNITQIRSWCVNKFGVDENALNKQFEIPADLQ